MTRTRLSIVLIAIACLTLSPGCGEEPKVPPPEPDLTGSWNLVMPAGFKYTANIEYMDNLRYRMEMEVSFGGVYEITGNKLTMFNPGKDGTRHYVWKVEDKDNMILVEAPTVGEVGSDYRGAVLSR